MSVHVPKVVSGFAVVVVGLGAMGAPQLADSLVGSVFSGVGSGAGSAVYHSDDIVEQFNQGSAGKYAGEAPTAPAPGSATP
jgi:hypothetical protein